MKNGTLMIQKYIESQETTKNNCISTEYITWRNEQISRYRQPPRVKQEEIKSQRRPITTKETESVIRKLQDQMASLEHST